MKKIKKAVLAVFICILLTSCVVGRKVKYNDLKLDLFDVKTQKIDFALLDHREAVIDGSRKPDFVGYMRSNVGIAYPISTESTESFMNDLSNSIINSLKRYDIKATSLSTKWEDDEKTVKTELLSQTGDKKILLVFDQLNTDGYMIQFLYSKINLYVYDKEGVLLKYKFFEGKEKLGGNVAFGAGDFKTYMPEAMKKLFETIFKDKEVIEAINKS
ncbi:hypothetical protein [Flavobacterium sp. KACC 22763]|uniref:hypothetical protein n=1 Tax=Flavobacterium sp. KACC 22763 TaxID=3025668 RepID=UPI002365DE65|nr:hypothetical protein [Flavobacterium sp. KACC 22763]WDF63170.1 hypothetical protein PQ463_16305 [Flavobacterium sp. KACC 22763]